MSQVYGPGCFFAKYINRDGYYAIFSRDGCKYFQSLTNFCQPNAAPYFIGYDVRQSQFYSGPARTKIMSPA